MSIKNIKILHKQMFNIKTFNKVVIQTDTMVNGV